MACGVGVVSSAADSPNGMPYGAAIGCPLKQLQHPVRHTQPPTQTDSTPRPTHTAAHPNRFNIPSDTHSRPPKPLQLHVRHTQPPTQTASTPRPTHTAAHSNRFNSPSDTHRHRLKLLRVCLVSWFEGTHTNGGFFFIVVLLFFAWFFVLCHRYLALYLTLSGIVFNLERFILKKDCLTSRDEV